MLHLLRHSMKCIWISNVFLNTLENILSSNFVPVCYFMNSFLRSSIKSRLNVTSACWFVNRPWMSEGWTSTQEPINGQHVMMPLDLFLKMSYSSNTKIGLFVFAPTPGGRPASPRKSSVPAVSFSGGWWDFWGKFHRGAAARSRAVSQQVSLSAILPPLEN